MNTIVITTTQNIELEFEPGSLGDRIIGAIVDNLIIGGYVIAIFALFSLGVLRSAASYQSVFLIAILALPVVFYNLLSEILLSGQSAGKKVAGIRVISLSGSSPSFSQYLIRWIFRLVDFTLSMNMVGVITIAATEKNQRVGDLIAGTVLVKTKRRTRITDTLFNNTAPETYRVTYPEVIHLKDDDIQLIKEVILLTRHAGNSTLSLHAQQKIEQMLSIKSRNADPDSFLQTVLSDYYFLTAQL